MSEILPPETRSAVCPFCGLLCDDLHVAATPAAVSVLARGCARSREAYARSGAGGTPRVAGREAAAEEAIAAAAALLAGAQAPLFGGLATDVAGMRALMDLAQRCGAVLDHMNAAAKLRNLRALQDGGWITTTLAEVKNRADLLVLAGGDVVSRFPRFFERFVWSGETLFGLDPGARDIVYLGAGLDVGAGVAPDGRAPTHIACEIARLGEAFGALRALLAGRRLDARSAAGVELELWRELTQRMRRARYGVLVWAAADFDFPHADLTVRSLCALIGDLNRHTRFAGLPLGGSDGDFSADAVLLWQTGYPFRTRLGGDGPQFDPQLYATEGLLARGEADALLWVAAFDARRPPPACALPTVVLGAPGMRFEREPEVYIPVGTPGVDHAAHLLRADKVVALHAGALRASALPSVAQAAAALLHAMPEAPAC